MVKINLDTTYTLNGRHLGPGQVEVSEEEATMLQQAMDRRNDARPKTGITFYDAGNAVTGNLTNPPDQAGKVPETPAGTTAPPDDTTVVPPADTTKTEESAKTVVPPATTAPHAATIKTEEPAKTGK